jgi:hypothetical protein
MTIWGLEVSNPPGVVNVCDEEAGISVKRIVYVIMY